MLEHPFGNRYKDAHLAKMHQDDEICLKLISWCNKPKSILYFCGNVGTGKTYFAAAFYNNLFEKHEKPWVRAFTELKLFSHLRETISKGWDAQEEVYRMCDCQYLILDDMGSSTMTDWQKETLFNLIDTRTSSKLPTLITSNLTRHDIKEKFHERFASRLYSSDNLIIEQKGDDRRQGGYD